jgi:hypothetical protein
MKLKENLVDKFHTLKWFESKFRWRNETLLTRELYSIIIENLQFKDDVLGLTKTQSDINFLLLVAGVSCVAIFTAF